MRSQTRAGGAAMAISARSTAAMARASHGPPPAAPLLAVLVHVTGGGGRPGRGRSRARDGRHGRSLTTMRTYDSLYIDGQWVASTGSGSIDVVNAATEEVMGSIPEGTPEDVDRAVA